MLDLSARYSVDGMPGVAFYAIGYGKQATEERWTYVEGDPDLESSYAYDPPEVIDDTDTARVVMVGDDRGWTVDIDSLHKLSDGDYCSVCGQIGCTHNY